MNSLNLRDFNNLIWIESIYSTIDKNDFWGFFKILYISEELHKDIIEKLDHIFIGLLKLFWNINEKAIIYIATSLKNNKDFKSYFLSYCILSLPEKNIERIQNLFIQIENIAFSRAFNQSDRCKLHFLFFIQNYFTELKKKKNLKEDNLDFIYFLVLNLLWLRDLHFSINQETVSVNDQVDGIINKLKRDEN